MSDKIFVPIYDGRNKNHTLHEVKLSPKGSEGKDGPWAILGAAKIINDFLESLKMDRYANAKRHLEDKFREIEFKLDPHVNLPETAQSVLLGICVKAEMKVKKKEMTNKWASVTITGGVTKENSGFVLKAAESESIGKKYAALAEKAGKENGDKISNSAKKHLFIYVSKEKITGLDKNAGSGNLHTERFLPGHHLRKVFDFLFVPMISSESGRYFENHTIFERFHQVYDNLHNEETRLVYYDDNAEMAFTPKDYWDLIPEDHQKNDTENCKKYRDLFFAEIDPYIKRKFSVKRFFKKAPFIINEENGEIRKIHRDGTQEMLALFSETKNQMMADFKSFTRSPVFYSLQNAAAKEL
jgi:hypothetical protein